MGRLDVVCGSMFSGKSDYLIREVRRARIAKQRIVVVSHTLDSRYGKDISQSHDGAHVKAVACSTVQDIEKHVLPLLINNEVDFIAIDEAQFFGEAMVSFCMMALQYNVRILIVGLDQDFRGEPWNPMPDLMARADTVKKLQAICNLCGKPANHTQRLIDGFPAPWESDTVLVGAQECYEARCRMCHYVPSLEEWKTLDKDFTIIYNK